MLKINKTYTGTTLKAKIFDDNLYDKAEGIWEIVDDNGYVHERGNIRVDRNLYQSWDGSNEKALAYIASSIGITEYEMVPLPNFDEVVETQTESTNEQEGFADES